MIVVNRFRVEEDASVEATFRADVHAAKEALAARPGYLDGLVGRNLDDPGLWLLTTTWTSLISETCARGTSSSSAASRVSRSSPAVSPSAGRSRCTAARRASGSAGPRL